MRTPRRRTPRPSPRCSPARPPIDPTRRTRRTLRRPPSRHRLPTTPAARPVPPHPLCRCPRSPRRAQRARPVSGRKAGPLRRKQAARPSRRQPGRQCRPVRWRRTGLPLPSPLRRSQRERHRRDREPECCRCRRPWHPRHPLPRAPRGVDRGHGVNTFGGFARSPEPCAGDPAAADGSPTAAFVATVATNRPHSFDVGTPDEDGRAAPAPAGASEAGHTGARGSVDPEGAPGSVVLRAGSLHGEPAASAPSATASALNASTVTAAGTGSSRSGAVSAQEGSTVAAFPDVEGAIGSSGLDIGDLAASISRPLAAGGGDYSVQVSLHPPELGQVRALLSLQGDVLHVTLTPEHSSGFDALSDALPTLHDQLAGGGVEVHVSLGQPGDQPGGAVGQRPKRHRPTTPSDGTSHPSPSPPSRSPPVTPAASI